MTKNFGNTKTEKSWMISILLIANYNSVVHKNDTVYLIGDICFRISVDKANGYYPVSLN